jgi:hypothetical protein
MSVDGEEWARMDAGSALYEKFPSQCTELSRTKLARGNKMAPFDDLVSQTALEA